MRSSDSDRRHRTDDGRRMAVSCGHCEGDGQQLAAELDPIDDTLYLFCLECEQLIATADVVGANVSLYTFIEEVADLDPQIRGNIKEDLEQP